MVSAYGKRSYCFLLLVFVITFTSCKQSEFYEKTDLKESFESGVDTTSSVPVNEDPVIPTTPVVDSNPSGPTLCENGVSEDLICNPLSGGGGVTPPSDDIPAVAVNKLGLIAELYEGKKNWVNLDRYFIEGNQHPGKIYFSNFNVPTRAFSEGFGYGADKYLKDSKGEKLIEWFALKAKGNILLPENETSGFYHIVTMSDDGVRVSVGGKVLIENIGIHSPFIDCASELVELKSNEAKSFELGYFQGPRVHISLTTFIKKIEDVESFKKGSFCSTFSAASKVTNAGYKVIPASWFTLPAGY